MVIINRNDPLDEDEGWLLLTRQTLNDRTLLCWYNPDLDKISISLFNLFERPNQLSRNVKEGQWGFMTHFVQNIETDIEATEVVNMYLKDLKGENFWWEKDPTH